MKIGLFLLSAILLLFNFLPITPISCLEGKLDYEEYDSTLSNLDDMQKLVEYIDKEAQEKGISSNNLDYAVLCESVVKNRFMWGNSFYSFRENWVAALAGKLFWKDLAGIVNPDYILKHKGALCSQQGLIIAEIFKTKRMIYRTCGFVYLDAKGREKGGHFAMETKINDGWYYIDPTLEPNVKNEIRNQNEWFCNRQYFSSFFSDSLSILKLSQNIMLGTPNAIVAANNKHFQKFTWYLSRMLWLFPLLLLGILVVKEKMYCQKK